MDTTFRGFFEFWSKQIKYFVYKVLPVDGRHVENNSSGHTLYLLWQYKNMKPRSEIIQKYEKFQ